MFGEKGLAFPHHKLMFSSHFSWIFYSLAKTTKKMRGGGVLSSTKMLSFCGRKQEESPTKREEGIINFPSFSALLFRVTLIQPKEKFFCVVLPEKNEGSHKKDLKNYKGANSLRENVMKD